MTMGRYALPSDWWEPKVLVTLELPADLLAQLLMTDFGFGSVHSAEFFFTIQQTRDFYGALLLKFGLAAQP